MTNEVMEKLEIFLQNLRCENRNRETFVHLENCRIEMEKLQKQREVFVQTLNKADSSERKILEGYIEQMQAAAFEEQQEAYLQGFIDAFQIFCGTDLITVNEDVRKIISKLNGDASDGTGQKQQ